MEDLCTKASHKIHVRAKFTSYIDFPKKSFF